LNLPSIAPCLSPSSPEFQPKQRRFLYAQRRSREPSHQGTWREWSRCGLHRSIDVSIVPGRRVLLKPGRFARQTPCISPEARAEPVWNGLREVAASGALRPVEGMAVRDTFADVQWGAKRGRGIAVRSEDASATPPSRNAGPAGLYSAAGERGAPFT
jgi:hypothetical protein